MKFVNRAGNYASRGVKPMDANQARAAAAKYDRFPEEHAEGGWIDADGSEGCPRRPSRRTTTCPSRCGPSSLALVTPGPEVEHRIRATLNQTSQYSFTLPHKTPKTTGSVRQVRQTAVRPTASSRGSDSRDCR